MSDRPFSISRGISSLLKSGVPTGAEAEFHFATIREREKNPAQVGLVIAAQPGRLLHIPLFGLRQTSAGNTGGATVGHRVERVIDLSNGRPEEKQILAFEPVDKGDAIAEAMRFAEKYDAVHSKS